MMERHCGVTLTRLAALGTLSCSAGEGPKRHVPKPLSRIAGEGGPSAQRLVGEGFPRGSADG
jgi:hypothetical protein